MKRPTHWVSGFALAMAGLCGLHGEFAPLKFKTYRDWDLLLPKEQNRRMSGAVALHGITGAFRTKLTGNALAVDRDGDGELDVTITGESGIVTFQGQTPAGAKRRYSWRLMNQGAGWHALAGGAAVGKVDGQQIQVIDQNLNGRFDEVGVDALIVGRGKHAHFLSEVVNVRGQLHRLSVNPEGSSIEWTPYEGPRGILDLTTDFASKGKLLGAVVMSEDGRHSFTLARRALEVPAGDYHLLHGRIGLGRNVVAFSKGKTGVLRVEPGATRRLALGEPVTIDFKYVRQPGRVIMAPQLITYLGKSGEKYEQWTPFGGSPQFDVRDMETGMQLALAVFGGC